MRIGAVVVGVLALFVCAGVAAGPASAAVAPTPIGTGERVWVFVDRQGITHVTWTTTTGLQSETHYRRRLPGAGSFSPDRVLPVPAQGFDVSGNFVVQDPAPSNRLVIITSRCCARPGTWAMTSTDGGATWSAGQPVYESTPAVNPTDGPVTLVANSAQAIYVMKGNPDIRVVSLPPSLSSVVPFDQTTLLSSNAPYNASVVLDERGQPVFAFGTLAQSFVRRGVGGRDILAGDYPNIGNSNIKIAGGPRGVVALVKGGVPVQYNFLETRKLTGDSLSAPVRLTVRADNSPGVPFIAADQAGRFHVVWRSAGNSILYRRSEDGISWSQTTTLLAPGSLGLFDLVASAGTDGQGWVVWTEGAATGACSRFRSWPGPRHPRRRSPA